MSAVDKINFREFYNQHVANVHNEYEHHRWFQTPLRAAQYAMTRQAIELLLPGKKISSFFELGPGAGTWTEYIVQKYQTAHGTVVDISDAMLSLVKKRFESSPVQLEYILDNFSTYTPQEKFDLFFSSRVLEYIPDTAKTISNIARLLKPGGVGIIITKMPHPLRAKLHDNTRSDQHRGQIKPSLLLNLLSPYVSKNIIIRPAVVHIPCLANYELNLKVFRHVKTRTISTILGYITESYIVRFERL